MKLCDHIFLFSENMLNMKMLGLNLEVEHVERVATIFPPIALNY